MTQRGRFTGGWTVYLEVELVTDPGSAGAEAIAEAVEDRLGSRGAAAAAGAGLVRVTSSQPSNGRLYSDVALAAAGAVAAAVDVIARHAPVARVRHLTVTADDVVGGGAGGPGTSSTGRPGAGTGGAGGAGPRA